jgi:hypothetical protein
MLANYFKIALRELNKRRSITFINLMGLSLGLVCCFVVFIVVKYDFSFDKFHEGSERIYRLSGLRTESTGNVVGVPTLPPAAINSIKTEIPGIENCVGFFMRNSVVTIPGREESKFETGNNSLIIADASYFHFFHQKLLNVILVRLRLSSYLGWK